MMNVLVNAEVEPEHLEQMQAVSEQIELLRPGGREAVMAAAARAEVIFGGFNRALFEVAERLRWVQVPSAGVDGLLFPEFAASPVTLVSAKGAVGTHLADQAMALLLTLIRG